MKHNQEPLTLDQLRQLDGQPVWIEEAEQYGLVSVNPAGAWKGIPFVVFVYHGSKFEWNVESRGLKVYAQKPIDLDFWKPCERCRSCKSTLEGRSNWAFAGWDKVVERGKED